ncbi:hypothetical protein EDC04DRAFT_2988230 [Pisolithus marmoratus]|nr:hypothetical protein EDC04DRAFT_2988230 [Pisolithus marmoratus]
MARSSIAPRSPIQSTLRMQSQPFVHRIPSPSVSGGRALYNVETFQATVFPLADGLGAVTGSWKAALVTLTIPFKSDRLAHRHIRGHSAPRVIDTDKHGAQRVAITWSEGTDATPWKSRITSVLFVAPTAEELTEADFAVLRQKESTRVEVAKASEAISVVVDALKSDISDIVRTFGDKLTAFNFSPKTAKKLQSFIDYI